MWKKVHVELKSSLRLEFHKTKPKTKFTLPSVPHPTNAPPDSQTPSASHPTNAPPHLDHKLQTQTQQTHLNWNLQREGENSKRDRERD